MIGILRSAALLLGVFTIVTGFAYPLAVTALAQVSFPAQANGSLLRRGEQVVGSGLIGQRFDDPRYFWGRPSATGPVAYDGSASAGSNLGPSNPALASMVRERVGMLRATHPDQNTTPVPVDLVTTSASGLDPHISPASALYQVKRLAEVRRLAPERVRSLVLAHVEGRSLGLLGEPRVNVLRLNLALDELVRGGD